MRVLQIAQVAAAILLVWAVDRHSRDYYTVLRWVVCVVTAVSAVRAYRARTPTWTGVLTTMALVFNPILPLHLTKATWTPINLISGMAMLILASGSWRQMPGAPHSAEAEEGDNRWAR